MAPFLFLCLHFSQAVPISITPDQNRVEIDNLNQTGS